MEYQIVDETNEDFSTIAEIQNQITSLNSSVSRRKHSYVWKYFRSIKGTNIYECVICNGSVGRQSSNLSRHLEVIHNITKQRSEGRFYKERVRTQTSRSFIWKYCTKEDSKYARCHLCNNLLYFGGGNTGNISKHLHRKHPRAIKLNEGPKSTVSHQETNNSTMEEQTQAIASINEDDIINIQDGTKENSNYDIVMELPHRKERKGASYVWNFCDKLSRNTIRCKLCSKVMSFHGTANVITHLQRKHNIVGKLDGDNCSLTTVVDASNVELNLSEDNSGNELGDKDGDESLLRPRRSTTMSVVWKYCTRISKDLVRCGFCKKDLSYQGTSNLQRHLHRMHGVVTQGRIVRGKYEGDAEEIKLLSIDQVWEHCSLIDDDKLRCNLCSAIFECKNIDEASKHLSVTHCVLPPRTNGNRNKRKRDDSMDFQSDDDDEDENDNGEVWQSPNDESGDMVQQLNYGINKKDDSLYNDLIEEEHIQNSYDEDPFDPNMAHEIPLANPLSPHSSRGVSPEIDNNRMVLNTRKLQKLNEQRLQMETEYFREKAGYYRMQKYLTALQARKFRLEMERPNIVQFNDTNANYTVHVDGIQHDLVTQ